jgi:hypothetical protein
LSCIQTWLRLPPFVGEENGRARELDVRFVSS